MHFSKLSLLSFAVSFATAVVATPTPAPLQASDIEARNVTTAAQAQRCAPSYTYCGWALMNDFGYKGLDPDGLFLCTYLVPDVDLLMYCANGCAGPTAHCK